MWLDKSLSLPPLHEIIKEVLKSPLTSQLQFILEPMSSPKIVLLFQTYGQPAIDLTIYLVRTFAFSLHREKLENMERWPTYTQTNMTKTTDISDHKQTNNTDINKILFQDLEH